MNPKTKIAMLPVLMLIAAGIFYYDSKGPSLSRRASSFSTSPYLPLPVENPALQRWKLDASRRTEYKSSGRDLFSETLPAPPPKKPEPRPDPVPLPPVEAPPPSLPANMKFFGYGTVPRSEEHTSELQSQFHLVCRLLLEKKKKKKKRRKIREKKKKKKKK